MAAGIDKPLRWAVVIADLEPVLGHEQGGRRRVLVVSNEPYHRSGRVTVCPITASWSTPRYPSEVAIGKGSAGQTKDAVILCHQIHTIALDRIATTEVLPGGGVRYMTDVQARAEVRDALSHHLGLDIPPLLDGSA